MKINILVVFLEIKEFLELRKETANVLLSKIKAGNGIDLSVYETYVENIPETSPGILKKVTGILYSSSIKRESVEELTLFFKKQIGEKLISARVSTHANKSDFSVDDVITLNNIDLYPHMIKYLLEGKKFFD